MRIFNPESPIYSSTSPGAVYFHATSTGLQGHLVPQITQFLTTQFDTEDMDRGPHDRKGVRTDGYLVYLQYDNNFNLVPLGSGAQRVEVNPTTDREPVWDQLEHLLTDEILIETDGFMHMAACPACGEGLRGYGPAWVSNGSMSPIFYDNFEVTVMRGKTRQINHYYPYGLRINSIDGHPEDYKNMYTSKELQTGEFDPSASTGLEMYDFHARFYDPQLGRWFAPDPAEQFSNPYLAMGNNPVMYVDPDGEFAVLAALIIKKAIVVAKAAKVAKVATVAAKTAKASKFATVMGKATSTKGITTGLKSGAINTISNYDADEGLGWNTLGDFAAGFAGGSIGYGSESKLIGMGIGGLGTWAVNGASFDYSGGQEFVGGALSAYVGMGKAVKGKHALFKEAEGVNTLVSFKKQNIFTKTLMKHGDNFVKYGLQNNAYDFAYTKEEDFRSRRGGHVDLFLWGGLSGAYQRYAWSRELGYGMSLLNIAVDWGINGAIKKRYEGIKISGSQANKLGVNYYKWLLELSEFGLR